MFAAMAKALKKGPGDRKTAEVGGEEGRASVPRPGALHGVHRGPGVAIQQTPGLKPAEKRKVSNVQKFSPVQEQKETKKEKLDKLSAHKELVQQHAKVPKVSRRDTAQWGEGVEAMQRNLLSSLAPSTGGQYSYWWKRFESFCGENNRKAMPFSSVTVAVFLSHLAENSPGLGGVGSARAALHFYYGLAFPDKFSPTDSHDVVLTVRGIKRRFQVPTVKKSPLEKADFEKILRKLTLEGKFEEVRLGQLRLAAQVSVMFGTISRFEETASLKMNQVSFEEGDLVILYEKGKTYQHGEARMAVLASQPKMALNPVDVVRAYIKRLQSVGASQESFLFPSLRCTSGGYVVLEEAASYDCVRNQFKEVVVDAGIRSEASSFGLHSMRRGGATTAVINGASDHAVMKQMRVSTTATVRRYASLDKKSLGATSDAIFK